MALPLRIEFPGLSIMSPRAATHGSESFAMMRTARCILATLAWVVERFGWRCHAYCLMDNHIPLLIDESKVV